MLEQKNRSGSFVRCGELGFAEGHQHTALDKLVEDAGVPGDPKGGGAGRRHRAEYLAIGFENAACRIAKRTGDTLQVALLCHSSRARPENTEISFFQ